jgi:hypothetical protein
VNGEVTLELAKDAAYTSDTIYIGQKNKLKLTATFDPSTTTGGMLLFYMCISCVCVFYMQRVKF